MTVRATLAAAVVVLGAALFASPGSFPAPVRYLGEHALNTPDPLTTARVDTQALRRAAAVIPPGSTYAIEQPDEPLQLSAEVRSVAHLFFLPSLETADPAGAGWILRYGAPLKLPAGMHAVRTVAVGDGIAVVEVARS